MDALLSCISAMLAMSTLSSAQARIHHLCVWNLVGVPRLCGAQTWGPRSSSLRLPRGHGFHNSNPVKPPSPDLNAPKPLSHPSIPSPPTRLPYTRYPTLHTRLPYTLQPPKHTLQRVFMPFTAYAYPPTPLHMPPPHPPTLTPQHYQPLNPPHIY